MFLQAKEVTVTKSCLGSSLRGKLKVSMWTIIHNYCRVSVGAVARLKLSSNVAWKTDSMLTLAVVLCLGLGSVESLSRRSHPANLPFTLRLSHSQSQSGDSAPIRTTAAKVIERKKRKLMCNQQQRNIKSTEGLFNNKQQLECLYSVRRCVRRFNFASVD